MCTTVNTTRNLKGPDPDTTPCVDRNRVYLDVDGNGTNITKANETWSSCEEWCLSMVSGRKEAGGRGEADVLQRSAKVLVPGLVKHIPAVANHPCLKVPVTL